MTTPLVQLKSCPCCKGDASIQRAHEREYSRTWITCTRCEIRTSEQGWMGDDDDIVAKLAATWNRRPEAEALAGRDSPATEHGVTDDDVWMAKSAFDDVYDGMPGGMERALRHVLETLPDTVRKPTLRSIGAADILLSFGWKWDSFDWIPPPETRVTTAFAIVSREHGAIAANGDGQYLIFSTTPVANLYSDDDAEKIVKVSIADTTPSRAGGGEVGESEEVKRLRNFLAIMPPDSDWRFVEQVKEIVTVPVSEWPSPMRPPEKVKYKINDRWECKLSILCEPGKRPRESQQEAINADLHGAGARGG